MSKWHGGKGSKRRPENAKNFNDNWDKIFAKPASDDVSKYAHPVYTRYPHLKELDAKREKNDD